jgi:hypothetical protein
VLNGRKKAAIGEVDGGVAARLKAAVMFQRRNLAAFSFAQPQSAFCIFREGPAAPFSMGPAEVG